MSASLISRGSRQQTKIAKLLTSSPQCDVNPMRRVADSASLFSSTPRSPAFVQGFAASQRCYSSVLPIDMIKDSIKSSLLDEASKKDSSFWDEKRTTNGPAPALNGHEHSQSVDIEQRLSDVVDVDTPINKPDPLDEWYLDALPTHDSSSLKGSTAGKISIQIPEGVAPLDSQINDPFNLSRPDVNDISATIGNDLVGTDHPVLNSAAKYFFNSEDGRGKGKQVRPVMIMLLSRALMHIDNGLETSSPRLTHILKSQRRLAEITEMIHTASLFHDDVIDDADTRRGQPAAHKAFGNKMAILAGDYLLARASICLARLRNVDVVECMSTVIEHLVRGEVLQIKDSRTGVADMEGYLRKNFYKTASLMANSCKSAALLGGNVSPEVVDAAYIYGKHVGVAFQLIDDALDFEGSALSLGKPALADLNAGLSTAPVLFAAESHGQELIPAMARKFKEQGDINLALRCVNEANGVEKTKKLAAIHAEKAIAALVAALEPSPYRDSLVHLACRVVDRKK
mmetsp:Transcript_17496/g.37841  ORF Transcript_17496/g.37841 Transcript_17496/m.37841 type:complete len:513 (-) Transcript_17496:111-1649(-)|eukprot:CAMPEP_0172313046 /NCGR_PEP_ID=MMETSP1058-20130122/19195_1 /TAXON_ID=83371 /ORGANISM="Detonula confervacea, Strain CCMP 353" /LENGTH=512 /DNA_ID=CAMNT_0013026631 /DNA_START=42 /DNA_END=1580 /DNA_ORIENTATION=+